MSRKFIAYDVAENELIDPEEYEVYLNGEGVGHWDYTEKGIVEHEDIIVCFETGKRSISGQMVYEDDIVFGKRDSHWHSGQDLIKGRVFYSEEHCAYHIKPEGQFSGGELFDVDELTVIGHKKYTNEEEF